MHAVNKHNTCSHTYPVNKHKTCCFQELPSLHLYVYILYICTIITYARCMRTKVTSPPSHPSSGFFSPPPVASLRTHPNQAVVEVVRYESPAGWQFSQQIMEMLNPKIPKTMHPSGPCFFLLSSCHPAAAPLGYPSRLQVLGWHRSSQRALCQSAQCRMKAALRDLPVVVQKKRQFSVAFR